LTALRNPEGGGAPQEADPIRTLQSECDERGEDKPPPDIQLLGATAVDNLIARYEITEAFFLRLGDCTGLLGATVERSHEQGEYPRKLDERAGSAAIVAADERPLMGSLNDCYRLADTRREQAICVRLRCDLTLYRYSWIYLFTAPILSKLPLG